MWAGPGRQKARGAGCGPESCACRSPALAEPPKSAASRTPVGEGAGSAAKSHTQALSAVKGQVWCVLQLPKNEQLGKKATQSNPSPIKSRHRKGKGTPREPHVPGRGFLLGQRAGGRSACVHCPGRGRPSRCLPQDLVPAGGGPRQAPWLEGHLEPICVGLRRALRTS